MHKFLSSNCGWIKSSYFPANKCYSMLAEMLHCSFGPLWRQVFVFLLLFFFSFRKVVKLLSCSALRMVLSLVIVQDGEYNVVREMSSGMCNQESFSLPKVCQCNAQSVCPKNRKKKGKKKVSQTVVKNVVGVPRGCFGNNMRSRPCDFFKFMINLWSLSCHPKDLL